MAHRLAPPKLAGVHDIFHVPMLRKYNPIPSPILDYQAMDIEIKEWVSYVEKPLLILDRKEQWQTKWIALTQVLRQHHGTKEILQNEYFKSFS